jgi:small subunit ribosomal protein S21
LQKKKTKRFGLKVECGDMPFEKALRLFRKKVDDSGLLKEVKERQQYEKPAERRKLAHSRAVKRWKKQLRSQTLPKNLY